MGLLGDEIVELFLRNNAISVNVGTLDHSPKNLIVGEFSQILGDLSEFLEADETWIRAFIPVFWTSKVMKTLWTSSLLSLSEGRVVIM